MLTFKEAIAAAQTFAAEIFPVSELRGFRVEALRQSDDQRYWLVTLGWVASDTRIVTPANSLMTQARTELVEVPRVYKRFKLDATSGELISMDDGA